MEDLRSPSESPSPNPREARSNRPDLVDEEFLWLDSKKVDEYRKMLDVERIFGCKGELIKPEMAERERAWFARGNMSYVFRAKIRGQWFALKRSWIDADPDLESYEKEVKSLQALRQSMSRHVILLIGHYKMPDNVGCLILSPLAECTLEKYISRTPTLGRKLAVTRWFGCLAGALENIHQQNIKHKDIKTGNILVHGDNIIITDLGISNKFTQRSTSLGDSPGSISYMAPEAVDKVRRGRQQDVWSLICCFIEMFSFIAGFTILDFRKWCNSREWSFCFYQDYDKVIAWLNHLRTQTKEEPQLALLNLLISGFKKDPKARPTASFLFNSLRDIGTFIGECCAQPQCRSETRRDGLSLSLSTDPQLLKPYSLRHFVVSAGCRITSQLDIPSIHASVGELLEEVELGQAQRFRSAERKLMFYIAPRRCSSAGEYLSLCNVFIEKLSKAVAHDGYRTCLYDEKTGEEEWPYTTAYFAILVEEIYSRCRTIRWADNKK